MFAGKIGTGFSTKLLLDLRAQLDRLEIDKPPFFKKAVGLPPPALVLTSAICHLTANGLGTTNSATRDCSAFVTTRNREKWCERDLSLLLTLLRPSSPSLMSGGQISLRASI